MRSQNKTPWHIQYEIAAIGFLDTSNTNIFVEPEVLDNEHQDAQKSRSVNNYASDNLGAFKG